MIVEERPFLQKFENIRYDSSQSSPDDMLNIIAQDSREDSIELIDRSSSVITQTKNHSFKKQESETLPNQFSQNLHTFNSMNVLIQNDRNFMPLEESDSVKRVGSEDTSTNTQRHIKQSKPNRSSYISNKKKVPIGMPKPPQNPPVVSKSSLRPSDILAIEQNKNTIDQLCLDNQVLHENLQDSMKAIMILKSHIQVLQSQTNSELSMEVKRLKEVLNNRDRVIEEQRHEKKDKSDKWNSAVQDIKEYMEEVDEDFGESDKFIQSLLIENQFLRKILGLTFSEKQLIAVEEAQAETEFNFFDNFCISRRDLENQAIVEYEKQLVDRKGKIEKQFVDWHVSYMNEQQVQHEKFVKQSSKDVDFSLEIHKHLQLQGQQMDQEEDFRMSDDQIGQDGIIDKKKKQVTKEEKDRILAELLKPLSSQVQKPLKAKEEKPKEDKSFFESKNMLHGDMGNEFMSEQEEEKKKKQLSILNQQPTKDIKGRLSLQIDLIEKNTSQAAIVKELNLDDFVDQFDYEESEVDYDRVVMAEPVEELKKSSKDIMSSLEQGWKKLMNSKQQKDFQQKKTIDVNRYEEEPFMYSENAGNFMLAQQNYDSYEYEDDEDDELYDVQEQTGQLSKTKKSQELQFQKQG